MFFEIGEQIIKRRRLAEVSRLESIDTRRTKAQRRRSEDAMRAHQAAERDWAMLLGPIGPGVPVTDRVALYQSRRGEIGEVL